MTMRLEGQRALMMPHRAAHLLHLPIPEHPQQTTKCPPSQELCCNSAQPFCDSFMPQSCDALKAGKYFEGLHDLQTQQPG